MADDKLLPSLAYELQRGKVYLLEVDRAKVSNEQALWLAQTLKARGLSVVIVKSIGGDALRLVPPPQEVPDGK